MLNITPTDRLVVKIIFINWMVAKITLIDHLVVETIVIDMLVVNITLIDRLLLKSTLIYLFGGKDYHRSFVDGKDYTY